LNSHSEELHRRDPSVEDYHLHKTFRRDSDGFILRYTLANMAEEVFCEERLKLGQEVARAVQAIFSASEEELRAAQKAERKAVKALEDHIKLHGCATGSGISKSLSEF
jgi:hypothetical protein